jgi:hypothetical protein
MIPKFKTSEQVTILDQEGKPLVKGAIVRSFNTATEEYHLTIRSEKLAFRYFMRKKSSLQKIVSWIALTHHS